MDLFRVNLNPKGQMPAENRRLAAIMFTDMVGFTTLSQINENLAMELLEEHRRVVRPLVNNHGGTVVKTMGDAFLIEFGSPLEAVRCAIDIQRSFHDLNAGRGFDRKILTRIGVHVGDVIHASNDVYGDAVNVASRIEPLAPPGGVCITAQVNDHVKNRGDFHLTSLGSRNLKNVGEPVEVFRVSLPWEANEDSVEALDKRRVAILPFANLSSDPEEGYFADGMTEELITSVAGVRDLTVIARTSVMKYKGSQKGAAEIGRELRAGSLIEGSVRKAGTRIRINAQLIDTATEGHLWARNYDRDLQDVFAIQSEIAEKVAEELRVRIVESDRRLVERKPTENTEAYVLFLRGKEFLRENSHPSLKRAVGLFEKATGLDPSFAKAYSGLADCFNQLANSNYERYETTITKAEIAANKALQLDPDLAEAHATLSTLNFTTDDLRACEAEAKKAIELNPSLPEPYFNLANIAFTNQNPEDGIRLLEKAYNLDPASSRVIDRLGAFYFYLGREDDALRHWGATNSIAPAEAHRNMTEYYLSKGDVPKAKESYSMAEKFEPSNFWNAWMKGFIAARSGDKSEALQVVRRIEQTWSGAGNLNGVAFIYYSLGDMDSYFAYLNRAVDQHLYQFRYFMYCPLFEEGREDARYSQLLERIKRISDTARKVP